MPQEERSFQALMDDLRSGQEDAAEQIVNEYTSALVAVARKQIGPRLSRRLDAEDVVQSTYRSLFVRVRDGEYDLASGQDLWKLLVAMTLNKVRRKARFNSTDRRNMMLETSALSGESGPPVEHTAQSGPTPEDALGIDRRSRAAAASRGRSREANH